MIRFLFIILLIATSSAKNLTANNETSSSRTTSGYYDNENLFSLAASSSSFNNRCQHDSHCSTSNSACLNGSCIRLCNYNQLNESRREPCHFYHCDGKLVLSSNSSSSPIETNNYPHLARYLSNRKCSWILKNTNYNATTNRTASSAEIGSSAPLIDLEFTRFATQLLNDYLYIFTGDSVFSQLIAALSGDSLGHFDPSVLGEPDHIRFVNVSNLFLLFKTDIQPLGASFVRARADKPEGLAIKHKYSMPCDNCGANRTTGVVRSSSPLVDSILTHDYSNTNFSNQFNGTARRAQHCSFIYQNMLYDIGGFSFAHSSLSFVSRLDLLTLKWEHNIDRRSSIKYQQGTQIPTSRYAHSCALDEPNQLVYVFGGIKLVNEYDTYELYVDANRKTRAKSQSMRIICNELWSFNLKTNQWTLLNKDPVPHAPDKSDNLFSRYAFGSPRDPKQYVLPLAVAGSCIQLVVNKDGKSRSLLVFSGYSEYYGSTLNIVQEFNLLTRKWTLHNLYQSNVNLGFGVNCLQVNNSSLIYVHGGLIVANSNSNPSYDDLKFSSYYGSASSSGNRNPNYFTPNYFVPNRANAPFVSNQLYSFDAHTNEWKMLSSASKSCYLHSSCLYGDIVTYYGGICVNETSSDDEDYSNRAFVSNELDLFNVTAQTWLSYKEDGDGKLFDGEDSPYSTLDIFSMNYNRIFEKIASRYSNNQYKKQPTTTKEIVETRSFFKLKLSNKQRYAHSAHLVNESTLLIHAGFNGFFLDDLFKVDLKKVIEMIRKANQSKSVCDQLSSTTNGTMHCEKYEAKTIVEKEASKRVRRQLVNTTNETSSLFDDRLSFVNNNNKKSYFDSIEEQHRQNHLSQMILKTIEFCSIHSTCESCQSYVNCVWNSKKCEYYSLVTTAESFNALDVSSNNYTVIYKKPTCSNMCSEFKSCYNCTTYVHSAFSQEPSNCVWCATQSKCVLRKAASVYYSFGECIHFVEESSQCFEKYNTNLLDSPPPTSYSEHKMGQHNQPANSLCSTYYSNCTSCIRDENCGWCTKDILFPILYSTLKLNGTGNESAENWTNWLNQQSTLNTGFGLCMEGSESGSLFNKCKQNWFFSNCPACECNGHSTCDLRNTSTHVRSALSVNFDSLRQQSSSSLKPNDYLLLSLLNVPNLNSVAVCGPCLNNTEGEYCSQCKQGYFGDAKNNGVCQVCNCTGQGNLCDPSNGRCYCNTKGVIGSKCDQCESPRYSGRPTAPDGTCYYNLSTDYQFTFNLNKDSDRYYTRINFVNHPTYGSDDDIDFMIRCIRSNAMVNITFVAPFNLYDNDPSTGLSYYDPLFYNQYEGGGFLTQYNSAWKPKRPNRTNETASTTTTTTSQPSYYSNFYPIPGFSNAGVYNYYFGPLIEQQMVLAQVNCTNNEFKYTFNNRDFNYGDKNRNATFVVYVYDFETPVTIQIAFSRRSRLQLLHFFVTFFGCLLSLLAIAFIIWKSKQRYDRYRRQRQIVMQMEYMSSRPFARMILDVSGKLSTANLLQLDSAQEKLVVKEVAQSSIIRRQSGNASTSLSTRPNKTGKSSKKEQHPTIADQVQVNASSRQLQRIMPVGVEPLNNNKTAILTCLLKLPQGDLTHTPKGASPLILASAFVQLNSSSPFLNPSSSNSQAQTNGEHTMALADETLAKLQAEET